MNIQMQISNIKNVVVSTIPLIVSVRVVVSPVLGQVPKLIANIKM